MKHIAKYIISIICLSLIIASCLILTSFIENAKYSPFQRTIKQIEKDYKKKTGDSVQVMHYYGNFDGCIPVRFSYYSFDLYSEENIGGITFYYESTDRITVWKNGNFYSVEEAYNTGMLSYEQLKNIADIHNNGKYRDLLKEKSGDTPKPSPSTSDHFPDLTVPTTTDY